MSNTILNVRFGSYHFQIVRLSDWRGEIRMGRSPITFRHNDFHDRAAVRADPAWSWFQWY